MNSTVYNVGVKIDGSAAGLVKASKEALAETKALGTGLGKEYTKVGKTRETTTVQAEKRVRQEVAQTLAQTKMLGGGMQREFTRMAQAREALGIRPEKRIQQEIARTEAAYNRLARSGALSFNEQRRAALAMRNEVTKLTNEMGRLTTRQKAVAGFKVATGVGVAVGVTGAMVTPPIRQAMGYDLRLAHLANTGYNDRNRAGRAAGRRALDADIIDAVRYGGGTRDGAMTVAEKLYGAGQFKPDEIKSILRDAVRGGTANDADAGLLSEMAIKANKTMGIAPDQMGRLFGIATYAGQSGGFELKDMAKHLPSQMAFAKKIGMAGERDFAKLVAVNQAAVNTAGTKDEAGNNVTNLVGKMGSEDTIKQLKKLGVDIPKSLAEGRMKGLDAFDVYGNLLDAQLAKDKNYQNVQKQLLSAKDGSERQAALRSVGDIAQGTVFGQVFQDREALLGLLGFMNDRPRVNSIAMNGPKNADASNRNYESISDTASFKWQQAANARDIAFQATIDKMLPSLGGVADRLTDLMTKYPGYTTAVAAATAAVTALAGAAGLAALALGGKGLPGLPGAGAPGAGAGAAGAGKGMSRIKGLGKAGGLLGAAMLFTDLFYTSPEDVAALEAAERRKSGPGSGIRGQGFNDPRIIGSAGSAAALQEALRATEVKGEITVRVTAAPGLNVETTMNSNSPRIPMKSAVGQTNLGAGY